MRLRTTTAGRRHTYADSRQARQEGVRRMRFRKYEWVLIVVWAVALLLSIATAQPR